MRFFMAFLFAFIPALVVGASLYPFVGPFAILIGWAVWGMGMEICLYGSGQ